MLLALLPLATTSFKWSDASWSTASASLADGTSFEYERAAIHGDPELVGVRSVLSTEEARVHRRV